MASNANGIIQEANSTAKYFFLSARKNSKQCKSISYDLDAISFNIFGIFNVAIKVAAKEST